MWFSPWGCNVQCVYSIYSKKYAHGFVVLCFVVVTQSFIMNSHEVFIDIHQGCFAGTGAIVRLPQCQWSKPVGYGKISQCITTTKHSKAKTVCIFLGIYYITVTSHRCQWGFSSVVTRVFLYMCVHANTEEIIKALNYWHFVRETTSDRWMSYIVMKCY